MSFCQQLWADPREARAERVKFKPGPEPATAKPSAGPVYGLCDAGPSFGCFVYSLLFCVICCPTVSEFWAAHAYGNQCLVHPASNGLVWFASWLLSPMRAPLRHVQAINVTFSCLPLSLQVLFRVHFEVDGGGVEVPFLQEAGEASHPEKVQSLLACIIAASSTTRRIAVVNFGTRKDRRSPEYAWSRPIVAPNLRKVLRQRCNPPPEMCTLGTS